MKTGRNAPCPCGSGQKFKKCCEGKGDARQKMRARGLATLLVVVLLAVVAGIVIELRSDDGPQVLTVSRQRFQARCMTCCEPCFDIAAEPRSSSFSPWDVARLESF